MNIPSPCFVIEETKLRRNLEIISSVQKEAEIDIILAFKGFAMWKAFPIMKEYISGATASSLNEVMLCEEEMGVKAHTYCVAYADDEFDSIARSSSHLTFNSIGQYHNFIDRVPEGVSVGLRVNPEWSDVETDLYNPSSQVSRLGMTSDTLDVLPERVEGLHFHVLCESSSYALENVLKAFEERFGHFLPQLKWVNMGGGHLMTRERYDLDHLTRLLRDFKSKHDVNVILEPGSSFAWQTGDLHCKVLDIVENGGVKTAIFDGSFTCHMPDCLEMPYRPALEHGSADKIEGWYPYRLGGVSCLAGDFLEDYWFETPLSIGDPIIFKDMIHYTMVKTTTFNGVKHPGIGMIKEDGSFELYKSFDYRDFKGRLS